MRKFRPVWLENSPGALSSDDLGAYLVWIRHHMSKMDEVNRDKAKRIQRELVAEQKRRRTKIRP